MATSATPSQNAKNILMFDSRMFAASLAYYGLPADYSRILKAIVKTDRGTGETLYKPNGEKDTTLIACKVDIESRRGVTTWVQVNIPHKDTALTQKGNPKKASNTEIARLANVTLDFEYPQHPEQAHRVGKSLALYLESIGFAEEGLPVEDSGAGCHIVLPLQPIEITKEKAHQWNKAVAQVVEQYIKPEFKRISASEGVEMDLEGFDISRILSSPGTWRAPNPQKNDCDMLKNGYLRRWLSPYVDGKYPTRKESMHLTETISFAYKNLETPQSPSFQHISISSPHASSSSTTTPRMWLAEYARRNPIADRSAFFQKLVQATYLRFDESTVLDLKEDINQVSGEKYNGRLDAEIARSLERARQIPKQEYTPQKSQKETIPQNTTLAPDELTKEDAKENSQAIKLVNMALSHCDVFSTPKGEMYARVRVNGRIETMTLSDKGAFKRWLIKQYRDETNGGIPNATALASSIEVLASEAEWGKQAKRDVHVRTAYHKNKLYVDLLNEAGEIVEVDSEGWRILNDAPVCFRRPDGMLALPTPVRGGSLDEMRKFINVKDDEHWLLLKAWLLGTLQPSGPYAVLGLNGEGGSAKTSAAKRLRMLIDPHEALIRREPKDDQAFAIMAHNNFIVAFDNLSHISSHFSDLMCTLATGAGDAFRKHYSNDEECIFNTRRPQIFTGIEELATRGDLIDRCILIGLPTIEEGMRRDEKTLDREYAESHPRMLGALLDAVSVALRNLPSTHIEKLPRMADFALWVSAAEEKLTSEHGTFLVAYRNNKEAGVGVELEASPIGKVVLDLMSNTSSWSGNATDLLKHFKSLVDEDVYRQKAWPQSPRALSGILKRLAPSLRIKGVYVTQKRDNKGSNIFMTSDANLAKSDANDLESDANFVVSDAKVTQISEARNGFPSTQSTSVTQSDANSLTSYFALQEKREEIQANVPTGKEKDAKNNVPENLRHFATQLAKLKNKIATKQEVFWTLPESQYPNGYVSPKDYYSRIKECLQSENLTIRFAAQELLEKQVG